MSKDIHTSYREMWESYGQSKSEGYFTYKFVPTHRIGLTNFLREEQIITFLDPSPDDVILDAGCASGQQLFRIAAKIKEGQGTDIAQAFVDAADEYKAKHGVGNLHFHRAPVEELPFPDQYFTKALCAEVLEHVFDLHKALEELRRILRPAGILVISVPNMNADATLWGRTLRLIGVKKFVPLDTFTDEALRNHGDAHVREFTRDSLWNWLQDNGFKPLEITSVSFIDGPRWFETLLKVPLRIKPLQKLIIGFEHWLTRRGFFWGRQLIIKAQKAR